VMAYGKSRGRGGVSRVTPLQKRKVGAAVDSAGSSVCLAAIMRYVLSRDAIASGAAQRLPLVDALNSR